MENHLLQHRHDENSIRLFKNTDSCIKIYSSRLSAVVRMQGYAGSIGFGDFLEGS